MWVIWELAVRVVFALRKCYRAVSRWYPKPWTLLCLNTGRSWTRRRWSWRRRPKLWRLRSARQRSCYTRWCPRKSLSNSPVVRSSRLVSHIYIVMCWWIRFMWICGQALLCQTSKIRRGRLVSQISLAKVIKVWESDFNFKVVSAGDSEGYWSVYQCPSRVGQFCLRSCKYGRSLKYEKFVKGREKGRVHIMILSGLAQP